jgi:hypothetical protein
MPSRGDATPENDEASAGHAVCRSLKGIPARRQDLNYRDCGIMRPMPAPLSKERGRFQGSPLESSLGGTGFFFFGSSVETHPMAEKATTPRTKH